MKHAIRLLLVCGLVMLPSTTETRQAGQAQAQAARLKTQASETVDGMAKEIQVMVDSVFSFGELGFQEFETARYLTGILEENGFAITEGFAGIPSAWVATWGSGRPVIALGADVDGIPQASQKPGVAYHDPLIEGAPGHGEGHNAGGPLNVAAALAVKQIMEREQLQGTLVVWPGIAEELLASKAWFVREGLFDDVDVCLFAHVSNNLSVSWGQGGGSGLVSVEYTFTGESAHSAGAPWRGRSALDAVELMNAGWNARREHLRLQQRSHYVITNGGHQPNVVPQVASVWYYFREIDYPHIKELWEFGDKMAEGATLMTNTSWSSRILGAAWPRHFNKPVAEAMYANIERVGLPQWSEADQTLARAVQREVGSSPEGLNTELDELGGPVPESQQRGGGSDDIGDVSWTVPTVTLRYPANLPGLQGHHWSSAIAMATPIAHKGTVAGAKVQAMTILDLLTDPDLLARARAYFEEQKKETEYTPLIAADTPPAIWLNKATMDEFRPEMQKLYYDPARYSTYLEQLGIEYPTVRQQGQ